MRLFQLKLRPDRDDAGGIDGLVAAVIMLLDVTDIHRLRHARQTQVGSRLRQVGPSQTPCHGLQRHLHLAVETTGHGWFEHAEKTRRGANMLTGISSWSQDRALWLS